MLYVASRLLRQHNLNDAPFETMSDAVLEELKLDMSKAETGLERVLDAKDDLQEMARQLNG